MPPVSPELDHDLYCIAAGKELGMPALEVDDLPPYWHGVLNTMWSWQDMERRRSMRNSKSKGKGTSAPSRGARGS